MITARQLMVTTYHSLRPTMLIAEAASLFHDASVHESRRVFGLMVIDGDGKLVGILSMYDILAYLQPKHVHLWSDMNDIDISGLIETLCRKSREIVVGDIMSTNIVTVEADAHLFAILELMNRRHVRRIPVTENDEVIGIVYISDLFFHLVERLRQGAQEG